MPILPASLCLWQAELPEKTPRFLKVLVL